MPECTTAREARTWTLAEMQAAEGKFGAPVMSERTARMALRQSIAGMTKKRAAQVVLSSRSFDDWREWIWLRRRLGAKRAAKYDLLTLVQIARRRGVQFD